VPFFFSKYKINTIDPKTFDANKRCNIPGIAVVIAAAKNNDLLIRFIFIDLLSGIIVNIY